MSVFTDESDKVKLWVNLDPVLREPADTLDLYHSEDLSREKRDNRGFRQGRRTTPARHPVVRRRSSATPTRARCRHEQPRVTVPRLSAWKERHALSANQYIIIEGMAKCERCTWKNIKNCGALGIPLSFFERIRKEYQQISRKELIAKKRFLELQRRY